MIKKTKEPPRGMKTLGGALHEVVAPVYQARGFAEVKLIADWIKVVGAEVAEKSTPLKVTFPQGQQVDGTLLVAVQGGYAIEIQHLEPLILEKIATYLGYRAISRVKIVQ